MTHGKRKKREGMKRRAGRRAMIRLRKQEKGN